MPLTRLLLVSTQAICYWLASTPPNPTPKSARFDGSHPLAARMAVGIFKIQAILVVVCAICEILLTAAQNAPAKASLLVHSAICPSRTSIPTSEIAPGLFLRTTPLVALGALAVACGTALRLICFQTMGRLFTFDLTIMPSHKLVTSGPYGYIRHPAYLGSLLIFFGIGLVNLTSGGWIVECGVMGRGHIGMSIRFALFCTLMLGWLAIGVHRARAEDAELRRHFEKEWDIYAQKVRWWFVPGGL